MVELLFCIEVVQADSGNTRLSLSWLRKTLEAVGGAYTAVVGRQGDRIRCL